LLSAQGDNVTLDDTAVNIGLVLASPILAPGTITFNHSAVMGIGGGGNIAGSASQLIVNGTTPSSQLNITNVNTFGGGTIINDGWLVLRNNFAVGSGVINLAGTGFSLLEVVTTGQAGIGIPGVNVTADSILQFDGSGAFAGVVLGPVYGTAGKTLTVQAPAAIAGSNLRFYGDFTCNNNIVMNINGANWASYQSGTTIYNGVLSGNGIMYPRNGNTELNGANTFTQTIISQGNIGVGIDSALPTSSPVGLGTLVQDNQGDNGIYAAGGARTIENPFTWLYRDNANRWFRVLGTNQLTMSGQIDLSGGTNNVSRIFRIDNTAPSILSGVVTDSGQNCGITKTGNGALYLNNAANSYTGGTTIGAGVLAGSGNIPGDLAVTNGAVGGGSAAAIGTLSVGGNVSFSGSGGAFVRLNRSGLQCDKVSVGGTLANSGTGTITVTNLGAALQVGDNFVLFPGKTVAGGSTLSITGGGVTWTNKLAVDGSIQVLSMVSSTPPTLTNNVSGNTLTLSWPATHLGWSLQAQTNSLNVGIANNWVTIPGTASVTSTNLTINPANPTVFYRLFYVTP
jgi:fibronectin-binding autotransporter adhesin